MRICVHLCASVGRCFSGEQPGGTTKEVPYSTYDSFAWYYRRGWGDDYHRNARPVFQRYVFPRVLRGGRVLDLCCGTGDLSALLIERGYSVTGIDGSAEMLRFAREKAPSATFLCEDARSFDLPPEFDAAFSTFDSLNHILEPAELEQVFSNVHRALRPGGLFVFDLNMEEAFEQQWHGTFGVAEETCVGMTRGSYDSNGRLGRADVTLFRLEPNGFWSRSDTVVFERCFTEEETLGALRRAGFTGVEGREAPSLGMKDISLGREFFFAVK